MTIYNHRDILNCNVNFTYDYAEVPMFTSHSSETFIKIKSIREELQQLFSDMEVPSMVPFEIHSETSVTAQHIDHTLLKPTATEQQIRKLTLEAITYGFASVCVNGRWVSLVASMLADTKIKTCAVVGFPLGAMSSTVKAFETQTAIQDGATEIDMVLSIGDVKAHEWKTVFQDIRAVVEATSGLALVKVILETGYLTDSEIIAASMLSSMAGAQFVKTSTGFSGSGATVPHVNLMKQTVGPDIDVKASGGIRTPETAKQFLLAGATRLGASRGPDLLD